MHETFQADVMQFGRVSTCKQLLKNQISIKSRYMYSNFLENCKKHP